MKIRRYLAKDTQEAILKVKMDLGKDALILNTRKVKQKGILKIFAKPMVEVLAAIDDNCGSSSNKVLQEDNKANNDAGKKDGKITELENKVTGIEDMLKKIYSQIQHKPENECEDILKDTKSKNFPKVMQVFYNNMLKNEVEVEIANNIIEKIKEKIGENSSVNDTAAALTREIEGILGEPETIQTFQQGKPTVVMFVGPTGVGKTTTLAKIAANYLLNEKKSIGLITADTYRIAAVEQLKTYGEILGIPLSVVYSASELGGAIQKYSDKDIVLIDTAGRSHHSKTQFEELKALADAANADEIFLVLSTATSLKSCRDILNKYNFLKDYKLVFTKTDEAPLSGIILSARYLTGKKLSYITNGQSVPDDIEVINIEKLTKSLIGSIG